MKRSLNANIILSISVLLISAIIAGCKKTENPIKFPLGTFPDSVLNLTAINSNYDDYNSDLYEINYNLQLIYSSNRKSSGAQFDLDQAALSFKFDQTTGVFGLTANITNNAFYDKLIKKAETPGNDFGPYSLFSSLDGYEYFLISSLNAQGNLDLFYLKNRPVYGSNLPDVSGPYPVNLMNTGSDDAYICFDANLDSAYFGSNRDGNFDIFVQKRPLDKDIDLWFNMTYISSSKADSINSPEQDKCPYVLKKIMFFASDRPGGFGGYDLYYSVFRNGKWNAPVNLGSGINTTYDEYRPVLGSHPEFTNNFLIFSSNRPGGKGGFDLYFTGIEFTGK